MTVATQAPQMALRLAGEATDIDLDMLQGLWSPAQYLKLTNQTNRLIEFTDGEIEVLPMPTRSHQLMLLWLYGLVQAFVNPAGGIVLVAPLRVEIRPGKFREPDILLLRDAADRRNQEEFWLGADLVIEIVSPDRPERDTEEKPLDYAEARIPEYWIVNPLDATITVLTLAGAAYATHGVFQRGETATSLLLAGFTVDVNAVFDLRHTGAKEGN